MLFFYTILFCHLQKKTGYMQKYPAISLIKFGSLRCCLFGIQTATYDAFV